MTDNAPAAVAIIVRAGMIPVFLHRALNSIVEQTYPDWTALVLHEPAGQEEVEAAVASVADRARGRIRTLAVGPAVGRVEALNEGLLATESRFVAVHDDSDTWSPTFLAQTVHFLGGSEDLMVATRTEVILETLEQGEITQHSREILAADKVGVTFHEILRRNFVPPISIVHARAMHDKIGYYDPAAGDRADWEFLLRALAHGPIGLLDGVPLAAWHRRVDAADAPAESTPSSTSAAEDAEALVRDRLLRQDLERHGGLGMMLMLADEFRRLDETTHAQTAHLAVGGARLEGRMAELDRTVASATNRLTAQFDLLLNEVSTLGARLDEHARLCEQLGELQRQVSALDRRIRSRTVHARVRAYVRAARRYARHG